MKMADAQEVNWQAQYLEQISARLQSMEAMRRDVATIQRDVAALKTELVERTGAVEKALRAEIAQFEVRFTARLDGVRQEMKELEARVRQEIKNLESALRSEIRAGNTQFTKGLASLRNQMWMMMSGVIVALIVPYLRGVL